MEGNPLPRSTFYFQTNLIMSNTHEIYSEAILFILDSLSPTERIQLKDDLRLKLDRSYELHASTLQGLKKLEELIKVSDYTRQIGD